MKLFFDKCRPNFFYRLYLDERTGYANGHNYSGMKPIKIALSKLSARGGGNGFFFPLDGIIVMLELCFEHVICVAKLLVISALIVLVIRDRSQIYFHH